MDKITIEKPSPEKVKQLGIPPSPQAAGEWSPWECEPSKFNWRYSDTEIAYVYEGKVKVTTDSEEVEIRKGDLVTFPKGLACTWQVIEPIRKVYKFK